MAIGVQIRQRARSTVNLTSCAVRFLICDVLGQTERRLQIPLGRSPQRLPELLSRAEIAALFGSIASIKVRTFLMTAYTHRTAISNERIRWISDSEVAFAVRADDKGGKRVQKLEGQEFVRRFLQHVLPSGVKRIRHYGVLASSCKAIKLNAARLALQVPALNPLAIESAQTFMARVAKVDVALCPCCKLGRLHVGATLLGQRHLPAPISTTSAHNRDPP